MHLNLEERRLFKNIYTNKRRKSRKKRQIYCEHLANCVFTSLCLFQPLISGSILEFF